MHEAHHLLNAIVTGSSIAPDGATFEDGYKALAVADAILRAADSGQQQAIVYEPLTPTEA